MQTVNSTQENESTYILFKYVQSYHEKIHVFLVKPNQRPIKIDTLYIQGKYSNLILQYLQKMQTIKEYTLVNKSKNGKTYYNPVKVWKLNLFEVQKMKEEIINQIENDTELSSKQKKLMLPYVKLFFHNIFYEYSRN